jgi:phosphonate degradation associated HDIG domain protein
MNTIDSITKSVDDIFDLYKKFGDADYIGEPVSQIQHMSQAAQLAMKEGCDDEVILAAFFHDIGHICVQSDEMNNMGGYGIQRHEKVGADFLRSKGFSERLVKLVENHVQAKRYLTFKYPSYHAALSEASKRTLEFQGGKMTETEAHHFAEDPNFEMSLLLRKWDELAKEIDLPLIDLDVLKQKAMNCLLREM